MMRCRWVVVIGLVQFSVYSHAAQPVQVGQWALYEQTVAGPGGASQTNIKKSVLQISGTRALVREESFIKDKKSTVREKWVSLTRLNREQSRVDRCEPSQWVSNLKICIELVQTKNVSLEEHYADVPFGLVFQSFLSNLGAQSITKLIGSSF